MVNLEGSQGRLLNVLCLRVIFGSPASLNSEALGLGSEGLLPSQGLPDSEQHFRGRTSKSTFRVGSEAHSEAVWCQKGWSGEGCRSRGLLGVAAVSGHRWRWPGPGGGHPYAHHTDLNGKLRGGCALGHTARNNGGWTSARICLRRIPCCVHSFSSWGQAGLSRLICFLSVGLG